MKGGRVPDRALPNRWVQGLDEVCDRYVVAAQVAEHIFLEDGPLVRAVLKPDQEQSPQVAVLKRAQQFPAARVTVLIRRRNETHRHGRVGYALADPLGQL